VAGFVEGGREEEDDEPGDAEEDEARVHPLSPRRSPLAFSDQAGRCSGRSALA
jgi:hypothetical protein